MIARYTTPEMAKIWSNQRKWDTIALVEYTVLAVRASLHDIPVHDVPQSVLSSLRIDPNEIDRIEAEVTKHDITAFLKHTSPQLPEELRPYWHQKLTSYDVQDTALSIMLRESCRLIDTELAGLIHVIAQRAADNHDTIMIGRTHGVHAEPITFGVKLANFAAELTRQRGRVLRQQREVARGKLSGAVGVYTLDPLVERNVCKELGLTPTIATQIIARDIHAEYLATLANLAGTLEKLALTIRLMQQTERSEAQEPFSAKQTGSSAMPHKRNPISSENICSLARIVRANALVGFENQQTWDERSLDNSASERIALVDSSTLTHYLLRRMRTLIENLVIHEITMLQNVHLTKGLIFSQQVQAALADKGGMPREDAYQLVRDLAQECWDTGADFRNEVMSHPTIREHLSIEDIDACFDPDHVLTHVDAVFARAEEERARLNARYEL